MIEHTIRSIRQHPITLVFRTAPWAVAGVVIGTIVGVIFTWQTGLVSAAAILLLGTLREYARWNHSRLEITTQRVTLRVRNGIFSGYELGLHFNQIKDIAYSKNHLFHAVTDSGTLFLRSSAGKEGEITADYVPDIVRVYGLINELLSMKAEDRKNVRLDLTEHREAPHPDEGTAEQGGVRDFDTIVEWQRKSLLAIPGITGAIVLSPEDRRYVFEHEEDRNHGVYEAIRRRGVLCITHDATFRDPDQAIVFRRGSKVIFPAVGFHEVTRPNAISGSPGIAVHEYLFAKFPATDPLDATILVGFD